MNLDIFRKRRHELFIHHGIGNSYNQQGKRWFWIVLFSIFCVTCILVALFISAPPRDFPIEERVTITSGSSLGDIADTLQSTGIIRSRHAFIGVSYFLGTASGLQAGDYKFPEAQGVVGIMHKLARGEHGNIAIRITVLEGSTLPDIAQTIAKAIDGFDQEKFIQEAIPFNGYLFPDTYYVLPTATETDIIEMMHDQFSMILSEVGSARLEDISAQELRNAVIMASIIEREAAGINDAYLISGILWERIRIDMPLQVDASFAYLLGKKSSELTLADLQYDSPYNTYTNRGLPPGPLGNPGKISLDAALHPAESPYLFYLHDNDGNIHYGKNHDEHVRNKQRYLR